MIDVTFLLLIYFLLTTVLAEPEDQLSPTLQTQQEEASGAQSEFQPQIVEVNRFDGTPRYRLGSQYFDDPGPLRDALADLPKDQGVFINVGGKLPVGFAVAAVQAARDAGFDQVTYVPAN